MSLIATAGIVLVRKINNQWEFLLLRAFKNFWDHPKDMVEPGESTYETAIREIEEETSIKLSDLSFEWGKISYTIGPYKHKKGKKVVTYYIAKSLKYNIFLPVNQELGHPEHNAWKWMTYEKAQNATNVRIGNVLEWANETIRR